MDERIAGATASLKNSDNFENEKMNSNINKLERVEDELETKKEAKSKSKSKSKTKTKSTSKPKPNKKRKIKPSISKSLRKISEENKANKPRKKKLKLLKWQSTCIEKFDGDLKSNAQELLTDGFTIFKGVIDPQNVDLLLNSESPSTSSKDSTAIASGRVMRKRKGNQVWMGAIKTMDALIVKDGALETVLSPLTTRAHGRYDIPLPDSVSKPIMDLLETKKIISFVKSICPRGKLRTQDILLSKAGSERQVIHTDSNWAGRALTNPKIHYLTILIPLTVTDKQTGGTRIWPKSHRDEGAIICEDQTYQVFGEENDHNYGYIDAIEPVLSVGDALIFDGLLAHCGLENITNQSGEERDRYFYYAAFSSEHDHNVDVTGS